MQTHLLLAHPAFPPAGVSAVEARWGVVGPWLQLRWRIEGAANVILPQFAGRQRADELWQTTCCEMFLLPIDGGTYAEFNFSPSEAWAAYDFAGWRKGMAERSLSHDPVITPRPGRNLLIMDVAVPLHDLPPLPAALSLTAVIEETGGVKSYWAMAHSHPERPDFHDPACFAASLAAPAAP